MYSMASCHEMHFQWRLVPYLHIYTAKLHALLVVEHLSNTLPVMHQLQSCYLLVSLRLLELAAAPLTDFAVAAPD